MTTRPVTVHTTTGPIRLEARDRTHAILSAQELAGPSAKVLRVEQEGEW